MSLLFAINKTYPRVADVGTFVGEKNDLFRLLNIDADEQVVVIGGKDYAYFLSTVDLVEKKVRSGFHFRHGILIMETYW